MIAKLTPRKKEYTVHDAGCQGLALRIQPTGAQSWGTWERSGSKTRRVTIGRLSDLDLDAARMAFHAQTGSRQEVSRLVTVSSVTFRELVAEFLKAKAGVYRPRTLYCLRTYLGSQLLPEFGAT